MPNIARIGDPYNCGDVQQSASGNVFAGGIPVARHGDSTAGHACYPPAALVATNKSVFVNNILAGRVGDTNGGHVNGKPCNSLHVGTLVIGEPTVFVES